MSNQYEQSAFEFKETGSVSNQQIGVRIKALKQIHSPVNTESDDAIAVITTEITEDNSLQKKSTRGRKSLKTIEEEAGLLNIPPDEILFSKQYYPIGEVAQMFNENSSVFRYWEKEFTILQPKKNRKGDRFYRPADIKNLELIYDLLRRRKLTIDGAKAVLKEGDHTKKKFEVIQSLQQIKSYLLEIKANL